MFRILVLYGTTEGQTARIARAVAGTIEAGGAVADVVEAGVGDPDPRRYDGVVVAASVHAGRYQTSVAKWVERCSGELNARPTAFVSVCLGVLQKDPAVDCELKAILNRFLKQTGWRPSVTEMVAGALRYTQYRWYVRWMMRRIAANAGGDTDTSRDYEYTDWNALSVFTVRFVRLVEARLHTGVSCRQSAERRSLATCDS